VTVSGTRGGAQATADKVLSVAEGDIQEYETNCCRRPRRCATCSFRGWKPIIPSSGSPADRVDGQVVTPIWLVVSHYLFFSEEWNSTSTGT